MLTILKIIIKLFVKGLFQSKTALLAENAALRQQLAIYSQKIPHPKIRKEDRIFWVLLSMFWKDWQSALLIVKPETVIKWHNISQTAAIDFFTVPTASFRILYCFLVLFHDRRKVLHFNVTTNPTAAWTIQQIKEAFPYDEAPRFMLRDRDSTYSKEFSRQIKNMGIEEVISAPQSPWQNPYVERMIGSIRRECLDHVIVLNEDHLRSILKSYFEYYHNARPHQSLEGNAPNPRAIEPPSKGKIIAFPQVGGLHHLYKRAA